ncbi:MAG: hypothetical protein ACKVZH_08705 [Blastocatellia bacterium]
MEHIRKNSITQLDEAISELRRVSQALRFNGIVIFLATLTNVVVTLLSISQRTSLRFLPLLACLVAILCVGLYEWLQKHGNVIFDEISDELEWNVTGAKLQEGGTLAGKRPEVNIRIVLRMFVRATNLPLLPGEYGPVFYFVFNLALIFVGFMLSK